MSIFTQLEQQSNQDLQLLKKAMNLLYQIETLPYVEQFIKDKIADLENEVVAHRKADERFANSTYPIDLSKWDLIERS